MEIKDFEESLTRMTKPEVSGLKHQDMLANAITKAKDKSVVSWWWLCIPLYIVAALLMKSMFMPNTTLVSNLHELATKQLYLYTISFLALPIVLIVFNLTSIRKIYFLSGSPKAIIFLKSVWFNLLMIVFSIIILLIYAL